MTTEPKMAYAARHECGRICAATVDDPERRKDVARYVGRWVRRGDAVERMPIEDVRNESWCKCFSVAKGAA